MLLSIQHTKAIKIEFIYIILRTEQLVHQMTKPKIPRNKKNKSVKSKMHKLVSTSKATRSSSIKCTKSPLQIKPRLSNLDIITPLVEETHEYLTISNASVIAERFCKELSKSDASVIAKKFREIANNEVKLDNKNKYNKLAADILFQCNNANIRRDQIDLHGLYVPEALKKLNERIKKDRQQSNASKLDIIVGRGKHSSDGKARIRAVVLEELPKYKIPFAQNVRNSGCITITYDHINSSSSRDHANSPNLRDHEKFSDSLLCCIIL